MVQRNDASVTDAGRKSARLPLLETESFQRTVAGLARSAGVPVYTVGGYVRDCVVGQTSSDLDLLVLGDGVDFARRVAEHLRLPAPVAFPRFNTARLIFCNAHVEIIGTLAQTDADPAPGPDHLDVRLRRDLARRDFTMNAMALPLVGRDKDLLLDLFDGQADLRAGRLRTPLEPSATFANDPIRLLRAVRFAARFDLTIEPAVWDALQQCREQIHNAAQERVTDELLKMIALSTPSTAFHLLRESGLLALVLPDVDRLAGVDIIDGKGHKDVFRHTLQVMDNVAQVSSNPALRFAALMHDIAKPRTKRFDPQAGWTFHGHEDLGARMTGGIARRLRLPKHFREYVQKLVRHHLRPIHLADEEVTDSAIRRLFVTLGDDLDDLMTLCRADITSKNPQRVRRHLANFDHVCRRVEEVKASDELRNFHSPVTGDEIMEICGIPPGPLVGRIKHRIEEAILQGEIPNNHDAAFGFFMQIKDAILSEHKAGIE